MRVAFLLPSIGLAGGIFIVLEHALGLARRHGHDVTIVTTDDHTVSHSFPSLSELSRVTIDDAAGHHFDLAVATWWHTVYSLPRVIAPQYAHFIQNLEDRFYTPSDVAARAGAAAIQALPLAFITTAGWLEAQIRLLRPDAPVYCVRSGIDKEIFRRRTAHPTTPNGPLRIAIEGPPDVWFKGVPEALAAVQRMREPRHLTVVTGDRPPTKEIRKLADRVEGRLSHPQMADVLDDVDVLLKLSRLEGMSGPPLEAFHCGATAVTTPVTGNDEYSRHGVNSMIVGYDDPIGTGRTLDLLARDRPFLAHLKEEALVTARQWPDWQQATAGLDAVITDIVERPPAADAAYVRQLILETYLRQLILEEDRVPHGPLSQLLWAWRHEGTRGVSVRIARGLAMRHPQARRHLGRVAGLAETAAGNRDADASTHASRDQLRPPDEERRETLANASREPLGPPDEESRQIFLYEYTPRRGDIVVDAGAGHGAEVVTFSRLVGPPGKVVAVEAHPEAFRELRALCERYELGNVELIHAALAPTSGTIQISNLEDGVLNSVVVDAPDGIWVPATTLDEVLRELQVDRIDLLKVNIEGAEVAALEGFADGIRRTRHVCIACHDFLVDDGRGREEMRTKEQVRKLLEGAGFTVTSRSHSLPWIADYLYGARS